jgi:dihydrofolate reductase
LQEAINIAKQNNEPELFIIGGAEIYQLAFPLTQRMYLTKIQIELSGDTFFPAFSPKEWKETSRKHHPIDERHPYAFDFVVYDKIN